jgi:hypothetical protein
MAFNTVHQCKLTSLSDTGLKGIVGGYTTSSLLTVTNNSSSASAFNRFTFQGAQAIVLTGSGADVTWTVTQVGIFDTTTQPAISSNGRGVRFISTILYGSGNTGNIITLGGLLILTSLTANVTTSSSTHLIMGENPFTRTAVPAFDQSVSPPQYTAARNLTFTNILATVAAGGFGPHWIDPTSGQGIRQ